MREVSHRVPAWQVSLDGADLTESLRPRLLELTLTETRGGEADELEIKIHDHDGRIEIPPRDAVLLVAIGWKDRGLVDKGAFTVDEVEHSGPPDVIGIRARSAELAKPFRTRAERSWHDTTLGAVLGDIAKRHGLKTRIDGTLSQRKVQHLDQTSESDAHLLTRLGKQHDAVATVKAGALVFLPIGGGKSASGLALPGLTIVRSDGDTHRYSRPGREDYTGVEATWTDKKGAQRQTVTVGGTENAKRLRPAYATEEEAREQAEAEHRRVQRGKATLELGLSFGREQLSPEQRVTVEGFKPQIDEIEWLATRVTHTITAGAGFTTRAEFETAA